VELLVFANVSGEVAALELPDAPGWAGAEILSANVPGAVAGPLPESLEPWEARIYRRVKSH
jgi:hypothetical protein